MTERDSQIEEIAKKLRAYAYDLRLNDTDDCRRVAEFVVETLNYRKMDEVTLKLDLGDRTPEEIKQIAEMFNGEIKKQVAKEIFETIEEKLCVFTTEGKSEEYNDGYCQALSDIDERIQEVGKQYGVKVDE